MRVKCQMCSLNFVRERDKRGGGGGGGNSKEKKKLKVISCWNSARIL